MLVIIKPMVTQAQIFPPLSKQHPTAETYLVPYQTPIMTKGC